MGCGKPSKIVPTTQAAVSDKPQPVTAPRPASIAPQPDVNTNVTRRSNIPVKAAKPRPTVPSEASSPDRASNSNSFKENETPPQSPLKPPPNPPSSTPKRTNSRPTSRVSNGHARGGGVTSPDGSVSGRDIKVQKRPRSRASGDLLNGGGNLGSTAGKSKNLLTERDMNGGNGTGNISNNSSLSAGSSKPLLAASKKGPKMATIARGKGGDGGKNSNSSLTSKPPSLELVVVVDPEVEGKTRIPRPRQTSQLVDPRRYIRVARSCEDLRNSGDVHMRGRSVSSAQPKLREASTTTVGQQVNGQVKPTRPQLKQRPRSLMLLDSTEAKNFGVGSWAAAGEAVKA